jgi:hypothetical protein
MIFIDYSVVFAYTVLLVFVALGVIGIRLAIRKPGLIRILLCLVSILILVAGWVIFASFKLGYAQTSFSPPIYSPDHMHAIRIEDDKMDPGSRTTVYLYSGHGFTVSRVFYGTLGSVKTEDVHWQSNSAVLITYEYPNAKQFCASTREVTVSVELRPSLATGRP